MLLGVAALLSACGPASGLGARPDAGDTATDAPTNPDDDTAPARDAAPEVLPGNGDAARPEDDAGTDAATDVPAVVAVAGACVLHNAGTPIPSASQGENGGGFRKLVIPGVSDVATLKKRCTIDVFRALLPIYCLTGNTDPVTFEVVTYAADGAPVATACAADGCGPYSCGAIGACVIRDGNLPPWNAPDLGPGYARKAFTDAVDFAALGKRCTPAIFDELVAAYCQMNRPSTGPLIRELALYNPDIRTGEDPADTWAATGCIVEGDGCSITSCP